MLEGLPLKTASWGLMAALLLSACTDAELSEPAAPTETDADTQAFERIQFDVQPGGRNLVRGPIWIEAPLEFTPADPDSDVRLIVPVGSTIPIFGDNCPGAYSLLSPLNQRSEPFPGFLERELESRFGDDLPVRDLSVFVPDQITPGRFSLLMTCDYEGDVIGETFEVHVEIVERSPDLPAGQPPDGAFPFVGCFDSDQGDRLDCTTFTGP